MLNIILKLFPLWALAFSLIAFFQADFFTPQRSMIVPLLMVIMLAMGLTLKPIDFLNVRKHKSAVSLGVILQFTVMPLSALLISWLLDFNTDLTLGMVLVGSVAGGTASNVMCYLAKGDVALSITMTACSTFLSVLLTPLIIQLLLGEVIDIPIFAMLTSLIKIVVLPVTVGILLNQFFHQVIHKCSPFLPLISMVAIVWIIGIVVALTSEKLTNLAGVILLAVIMHNISGLLLGYLGSRLCGFNEQVCRTVAFEVGMQNSGLATALAFKFFTPMSAVAASIFSILHNITGSILAGYWGKTNNASQ